MGQSGRAIAAPAGHEDRRGEVVRQWLGDAMALGRATALSGRSGMMRRAVGVAGVFAAALALVSVAPASWGSPAEHSVDDVTGDVIACDSATYTVTSGTVRLVFHEGTSASGNGNVTGTATLQRVLAVDVDGNVYSLRGAFWFGGAFNAQQGTQVFTDTAKLQVVSKGSGTVDSINTTAHLTDVNGNLKEFDFGTCAAP
jgi:hypothetical protein